MIESCKIFEEYAGFFEKIQAGGSSSPPEFMSTHPSNDSRIQNLRILSEKAKSEAKKFGVTSFRPIN